MDYKKDLLHQSYYIKTGPIPNSLLRVIMGCNKLSFLKMLLNFISNARILGTYFENKLKNETREPETSVTTGYIAF